MGNEEKEKEIGLKIYTASKSRKKFYVVIDAKGQMTIYDNLDDARETYIFITTFGIPAKLLKIEVLEENV